MSLMKWGAKGLFFALLIAAVMVPTAAKDMTEIIESGDGYMINNILIEVGAIGIADELEKSTTNISAYEWKDDSWKLIKNASKMTTGGILNFTASDGNYEVVIKEFRNIPMSGSVKVDIWTTASVTNSVYVKNGRNNAEGAGKPNLTITKVVTPSVDMSVDDVVTVMVYVSNTGDYDAKNVTITDPYQEGFLMSNVSVNNTINQSIHKNTNSTYLVYQLKAVEPGEYKLQKATAVGENALGTKYNYTQSDNVTLFVSDLAALTFNTSPPRENVVDYQTRSKIAGTITIRNTGTMPAQYVSIDFGLPDGATVSGKDINGTTGSLYIDQIMPNNQKIIEYELSATAEGFYEVPITYSYNYNGSNKTGLLHTVTYSATENATITTAFKYWYLVAIPVILIAAVAFFLWKRHKEYKF